MQDLLLDNWERRFVRYLESGPDRTDGSHDLGHFQRVWKSARYINQEEGYPADPLILLASAYFHDLVSLPKDHPQRSESSRLSAEETVKLLRTVFGDGLAETDGRAGGIPAGTGGGAGSIPAEVRGDAGEGFSPERMEGVRHAIHAHSFSAGIRPLTAEAKILQDADRLEAIGAIGLARVFYTAGQLHSRLFDPADPLAENREPDDRRYALDHFSLKLLKLPAMMNTGTGRRLAEANAAYLLQFLDKIRGEIIGDYS